MLVMAPAHAIALSIEPPKFGVDIDVTRTTLAHRTTTLNPLASNPNPSFPKCTCSNVPALLSNHGQRSESAAGNRRVRSPLFRKLLHR